MVQRAEVTPLPVDLMGPYIREEILYTSPWGGTNTFVILLELCHELYTCGVCELNRSRSKSTKSLFVISALDYETGWAGPLSVSMSALVATQ